MSKLLKLSAVKTFISPATQNMTISKGAVCRFSDEVAAKLLQSQRRDKDGDPVPYFSEVERSDKIDFDFEQMAEDRAEAEAEAPTTPVKAPSRQRSRPVQTPTE